jgi:histidine triad (HIT) family protein
MSESAHCIFCKIVRGEIPAVKVYEDAQTLTFMDVRPASPGHTLVISKAHAPNLLEIAEADLLAVASTVQRVARAVQKALSPDGIRIGQFNGAAAGQTVLHYHVHIVPMREGQKAGAHGREPANPEQLKVLAAQIRAALEV